MLTICKVYGVVTPHQILILTGGIITPKDKSLKHLLKKQLYQWRETKNPWLELKIKSTIAEPLLPGSLYFKKAKECTGHSDLKDFLQHQVNYQVPELTEVVLCTLLQEQQMPFLISNYDEVLVSPQVFQKKWEACDVIFVSTTFLRDLSELLSLLKILKGSGKKIIVGGALVGTLGKEWQGHEWIDLVAVGYGEYLVKPIVEWIRSGYSQWSPPERGRLEQREKSLFLISGVPSTLSLDFLVRPDWKLAEKIHGTQFKMIYYESVRGCPYRCAFCNYPYLFDDQKFRMKSAQKMVEDWAYYSQELNIEYITCLDSLFTMPKARLIEFCELLIQKKIKIKWVCYARADDLCDDRVVQLLIEAGCIQVQIGIESGDDQQLVRMNKRTTVAMNRKALQKCRQHGLTTVVTMIVGYPGETKETLENTFQFLKESPPDFFFIATFSIRVPNVPVLSLASRQKFHLITMDNLYSVAPYWSHSTMNCFEASCWARNLHQRLIKEEVCLDAALFYSSILKYQPQLRTILLSMQKEAQSRYWWIHLGFLFLHTVIDFFFKKDLRRSLPKMEMS